VTGRFVVVEGGDGSGKSTQRDAVVAWLRTRGCVVVETAEPGGTDTGGEIRRLVLDGDDLDPRTEALLMAADRAEHCAKVIVPALERGEWVVSDRHVPSSLVYQGIVRGLGVDTIARLSEFATQGLRPDIVLVLDVDDETAESRRDQHHDRLEREGRAFHRAVRQAYRDLASANGWTVVSGVGQPVDVTERLVAELLPLLAT
jgi:dTMP kinase